jgi:transcriptional regulator with XRE-family HTH domain
METIAKKIIEMRAIRQMDRKALSEKSGVALRTVQNVENGQSCSVKTLIKLAGALGMPPGYFFS